VSGREEWGSACGAARRLVVRRAVRCEATAEAGARRESSAIPGLPRVVARQRVSERGGTPTWRQAVRVRRVGCRTGARAKQGVREVLTPAAEGRRDRADIFLGFGEKERRLWTLLAGASPPQLCQSKQGSSRRWDDYSCLKHQ
jgi:hypothetical protein